MSLAQAAGSGPRSTTSHRLYPPTGAWTGPQTCPTNCGVPSKPWKGETMTTLGVIDVSGCAKPGRLLAGKPILEWVARSATDCELIDRVVVLAGNRDEAGELSRLLPSDVPLYRSMGTDALARLVDLIGHYGAEGIVRVTADAPFMDPVLIDRLVTTAIENPHCDYITYCLRDGRPGILSPVGLFAEWCAADALRRAHQSARLPAEREQPLRYVFSHPELFRVRLVPAPARLDRQDVRLRVGSEEDLAIAQSIVDALGPDRLEWHRIADLLEEQPALRQRMATLNQTV